MGQVALTWVDSHLMVGVDSNGHSLVMGSWPEQDPEWQGLNPSDLLLLAAASCSVYDIVHIMGRSRRPIENLACKVDSVQGSKPPHAFEAIHLHYTVKGEVDEEKLRRAIELSETKYCTVVNTLKHSVKITSSYEILSADN